MAKEKLLSVLGRGIIASIVLLLVARGSSPGLSPAVTLAAPVATAPTVSAFQFSEGPALLVVSDQEFAMGLGDLINRSRIEHGLPPLSFHPTLIGTVPCLLNVSV